MSDEKFDWAAVSKAATEWMDEHPDTPPLWLVLPIDTPEAIVDMATEIYDVPTILDDVEDPWFTTIQPAAPVPGPHSPMDQPSERRFSAARLIELAERGQLTDEDINRMTMDEYATVRHILLRRANAGGPAGIFKSLFKSSNPH